MKKKLNQETGFTLVEMLVATMILILLTMMLGTGLQMTLSSYQKITAQYEVDLLLSTALDALADDLRFAQYVGKYDTKDSENPVPFYYTSNSFWGKIHLEIDDKGQIVAVDCDPKTSDGSGKRFLSTGAYGIGELDGERAYKVSVMTIEPTYDDATNPKKIFTFTIHLEVVATADPGITASGDITVRCLSETIWSETISSETI